MCLPTQYGTAKMRLKSSVSARNRFSTGTEWLKHIHPEDQPRVAAYLDTARPDQPSHSIAFRYRRPDGGEVWLEQIAVVQFDPAGRPAYINGLTADITERKRFEDELSRAWKSAELARSRKIELSCRRKS